MAKTKEKRKTLLELVDDESVKELLRQPVGSPVRLTREQALAVVRAGTGGRPDLPPGEEYVRKVSKIWRGYLPRG